MVSLNLALNLVLIWPLAEAGLGVSTAISAAVETLALATVFSRRKAPLDWRSLATSAGRTVAATLLMGLAAWAVLNRIPSSAGLSNAALRVAGPMLFGAVVYVAAHWLFGGRELLMLTEGLLRRPQGSGE